jgi:hypothetical protein
MKINAENRDRMLLELRELFAVLRATGKKNPELEFIESRDKPGYWVQLHVWKRANLGAFPIECRKFFQSFRFDGDHELYPCESNDASLSTALNAIAKDFIDAGIEVEF